MDGIFERNIRIPIQDQETGRNEVMVLRYDDGMMKDPLVSIRGMGSYDQVRVKLSSHGSENECRSVSKSDGIESLEGVD